MGYYGTNNSSLLLKLPERLREDLYAYAADRGMPASEVIRQLIEAALEGEIEIGEVES